MKNKRFFHFSLLLVSLIVFQLSFVSCDDAKSRAKKILSLKNERQELIDNLYTKYGGSDLANAVKEKIKNDPGVQQPEGKAVNNGISAWATNVDRGFFEETVRAVGQGEGGTFFSDRARVFFSQPDIKKLARKYCEIEIELELLQTISK